MPSFPVPKGRRSKRVTLKKPASLVINLDRKPKRLPCLVLDSSKEGFRLRGSFDLRRGHVVELILDEDPLRPERLPSSSSHSGGKLDQLRCVVMRDCWPFASLSPTPQISESKSYSSAASPRRVNLVVGHLSVLR